MIPLTPAQHRLWFLEQAGTGGATYLTWHAYRLTGPLSAAALEHGLRTVVARHDALRTAVVDTEGEPASIVHDPGAIDVPLEIHEAADLDRARELAGRIVSAPFDLARAPLFRSALIRLAPRDHVLVLCAHHIVCDGPSMATVAGDLLACYAARRREREPDLPDPGEPFAAYAAAGPASAREDDDRAYWKEHLTGAPELVGLPADRPRTPAAERRGAELKVRLTPELAHAVRTAARRERCTLFMVLLTAVKILLARESGQQDVVVGSPVAARTEGFESTVGMFVNTLALRTDLTGNPAIREALRRVRRTTLGGLGHHLFPFDRVVEMTAPQRGLGVNPVFQVMVVVDSEDPGLGRRTPELTVEPFAAAPLPARFDLTVLAVDGAEFSLHLHYDADLFDEVSAARYADHLVRILTAMAEDVETPLWDIPLLSDTERRTIVGTGGDRLTDGPPVCELVALRSAENPLAPAVISESGTLTYGELDRRANRLAHRLRALDLPPETPVAVLFPTSAEAVIALLGVLKAGCAYVPLDPAHPPDRLAAMLGQATPPALVTTEGADPGGYPGRVLVLDKEEDARPPDAAVAPDHLAYVVFTSGSTGRPKGVMVPHATVAALTRSFQAAHRCFAPGERVLMLPPLTFDASVGDLFPALTGGAALVLHPDPASLNGAELVSFCTRHGVTAVDAPVALWRHWTAGLHTVPEDWPVRELMVGGESVPLAVVRDWARITGGRIPLYNHYGPTEATVCATVHRTVDGAEAGNATQLPIGLPLPHVRAYVVDLDGGLAPIGVPGELYLGGGCVARGYLGDAVQTAASFVPDPFSGEPGARMYRTGDRARYLSDGTLAFLGRSDRQVKIRGHRIELGEIEAAVMRHPAVREAVAVAHGDRLACYLVGPGGEPGDLRVFLRRRLPEHMIPAVFAPLDRVPLTAHGKVDERALPPVGTTRSFTAPVGAVETTLAEIWAETLGVEGVGRHDNFFALGGHSLVAAPLLARVARTFGVSLPVRHLFETPDLAGLAASISSGRPAATTVDLHAEAALPSTFSPSVHRSWKITDATVLLTGATGFLGAHLLAGLLNRGAKKVVCLIRAQDPETGRERLRAALARYGLPHDDLVGRVTALPGDLSVPGLGLSSADLDALRPDVICHNGGTVNFLHPYDRLRPANVGGTREILTLAARRPSIPVHLVSSLGVFLGTAYQGRPVAESDAPDDPRGLDGGYDQSKWVADRLVRLAREHGLAVSVHRPARIAGDSRTGRGNPGDYFTRLLTTFRQIGMVPDLPFHEDLSPVDHVAAAIAHLVSDPESTGRDYHYFNDAMVSYEQIAAAMSARGMDVDLVPWPAWRGTVLKRLGEVAIAPFAANLPEETPQWPRPHFDCRRTAGTLAAAGIAPPPSAHILLDRYLEQLT
ncbi:non-ribosomal peptide synthetase [Sinosporangium siamense]|uniref:Non-ribosomal peptide synthetase n=1 Tax=Sinosporangium siamense TaxID=1367973 RepID=A0A919RRL0_9ACTN|nr:non-ribosomal peptide synthetase [Sinosporangium siamense]GII96969.1 non-ribosomal peptide synthetase [Sinosporangium siamense]